jgi:hypothetical protein
VALLLVSNLATAQSELAALEAGLASDDAAERTAALDAYASLDASDIPHVVARLRVLRGRAADPLEVTRVLAAFRHAVGSRRADDVVDLGPGVGPTLAATRDPLTVRMAAAVLLERAAERIATIEALSCIAELVAWGGDGMRLEGRRIAMRVGPRLAPAIIDARSHDARETRRWAEWAGTQLGLEEPGRFVAGLDPALVPDVLRAYARAHVLSAVPVAASFVDTPRSSTRAAAREALVIYGQNSIWVAREAYRIRAGEPADVAWGWRRTLDALYALVDRAEDARVTADLSRATAALSSGDRETTWTSLSATLERVPDPSSDVVGSALVGLAELDLAQNDLASARAHAAIAARLPMADTDASRLRGLRLLLDAEARTAAGVIDTDAYARATTSDPTCEPCAERGAAFVDRDLAPRASPWRLWAAAAAFLLLAVLLWPARRPVARVEPAAGVDDETRDATLSG